MKRLILLILLLLPISFYALDGIRVNSLYVNPEFTESIELQIDNLDTSTSPGTHMDLMIVPTYGVVSGPSTDLVIERIE